MILYTSRVKKLFIKLDFAMIFRKYKSLVHFFLDVFCFLNIFEMAVKRCHKFPQKSLRKIFILQFLFYSHNFFPFGFENLNFVLKMKLLIIIKTKMIYLLDIVNFIPFSRNIFTNYYSAFKNIVTECTTFSTQQSVKKKLPEVERNFPITCNIWALSGKL